MDITGVGAAINAAYNTSVNSRNTQIGIAMLGKSLDTTEQMGGQMIKMMENSVTPYLGGNIDVSV
jgi:hypothetical protein